jgi:hypothetical protein
MGADFPLLSNEILLPNLVFFRSLLGGFSFAITSTVVLRVTPPRFVGEDASGLTMRSAILLGSGEWRGQEQHQTD